MGVTEGRVDVVVGPGNGVRWRGRHGEVHVGRESHLGRRVAVKVLAVAGSDEMSAFEERGPQLKAVTRHPSLVTVHNIGVHADGRPFVVMDLLPGRDLEAVTAARGSLTIGDGLAVSRRLVRGMEAAHLAGFVHGDIRPANILLDRWERPQLVDLGLEFLLAPRLRASRGDVPGLLAHTAPEVTAGGPATPHADVFSVAATLYTLLSGRPPFTHRGADEETTVRRMLTGEVVDLRGRGLPQPVWDILAAGMAPQPQDRHESMAAMAAVLHDASKALADASHTHPQRLEAPSPLDPPLTARHPTRAASPAGQGKHTAVAVNSGTAAEPVTAPLTDATDPLPANGSAPGVDNSRWFVAVAAAAIVALVLVVVAVSGYPGTARRVVVGSGSGAVIKGLRQLSGLEPSASRPQPQSSTVFAGRGRGVPGPAVDVLLARAEGIAMGDAGEFYLADRGTHTVYRIDADGAATVLAGNGHPGYDGDGGLASDASLDGPFGVTHRNGWVWITDRGNGVIRQVDPSGVISTVPASSAGVLMSPAQPPHAIAAAEDGTLYVTNPTAGTVSAIAPGGDGQVIAGTGDPTSQGDGGPARLASLDSPTGIAIDGANLVLAELGLPEGDNAPTGRLRRLVRPPDGEWTIEAIPGGSGLNRPEGVAVDAAGDILVASTFDNQVLRLADAGLSVIAGLGGTGTQGDGGQARVALLNRPKAIAVAADGRILVSEGGSPVVRQVDGDQRISTVVGTAAPEADVPASDIGIVLPAAIASAPGRGAVIGDLATASLVEVVDGTARVVSRADSGIVSPAGIAMDDNGTIYVADAAAHVVYARDPDGDQRIHAGQVGRPATNSEDDGEGVVATSALLNGPRGLAWADGTLYIADFGSNRIRAVDDSGIIRTVAGAGNTPGQADGPVDSATLNGPRDVAVDGSRLVIADSLSPALRQVDLDTQVMSSVIGAGTGLTPVAVMIDGLGRLVVADAAGQQVVTIVDGTTTVILDAVGRPGMRPVALAIEPTSEAVLVVDQANGTVWRVPR